MKKHTSEIAAALEIGWLVLFITGIMIGWLLPVQPVFIISLVLIPVVALLLAMVSFFADHSSKSKFIWIAAGVEFGSTLILLVVGLAFSSIG